MKRIDEIAIKETRVRTLMEQQGLQGILLKTVANFSWFTAGGTNEVTIADTLGVTSILITEKERFIISNNIESGRMMEDEDLAELGFRLIEYSWHSGNESSMIADVVDPQYVGCDVNVPAYDFQAEAIQKLRYSLLPSEIDRYLWLGRKASTALETVLSYVRPGMRECMVTGDVLRILWYDRIDSICNQSAADGRSRKYRHGISTEKTIDKYVMVNVNARKWGLVTTLTRIVHFGNVEKDLEKQYQDNISIDCAMIAASHPGTATSDIFARTKELYAEHGYPGEWKLHHQGGGQGYRNREYLVYPGSTEVIQKNQCVCWNPTISGARYGTKSEDAFIATGDGPVMVTNPVLFPTFSVKVGDLSFMRPWILEAP